MLLPPVLEDAEGVPSFETQQAQEKELDELCCSPHAETDFI